MDKTNKQKLIDTDNRLVITGEKPREGDGEVDKSKGGPHIW